jgi:hypothetical protein
MTSYKKKLSQATTPKEFLARLENFFSDESTKAWQAFKPEPTDIIITTFPKSGTTWMQQIMHCLRSNGDMDFDEISVVVPWLEVAFDMGINLDACQINPRLFKSHLTAEEVPRGAKYIIIFRDPGKVLLSYYKFMEGWFFEPDSISLEEFAEVGFFNTSGFDNYWHHLKTWWVRRDDPNVLLLTYEEMKFDIAAIIKKLAKFADIRLTPKLLELTKHQSSHDFMRKNSTQFDDHATQEVVDLRCDLPAGGNASKIGMSNYSNKALILTPYLQQKLKDNWKAQIQSDLEIKDYIEFKKLVFELKGNK